MRVLVVFCHPSPDSFAAALLAAVRETLAAGGHDIRVADLYGEGFDPVLSRQAWIDYADATLNRAGVERHVADILWAEGIVFVYPTWWYGLPAMLKGYLDRVWVPHVTFDIPTQTSPMRPRMQHVRRLAVVTTCGASWWLSKLIGEPGRRTLLRGIRALCAPACRTRYLALYKMDTATPAARARHVARVRAALARW